MRRNPPSVMTTTGSVHARRIDPMTRSAYTFCHWERGAVRTSLDAHTLGCGSDGRERARPNRGGDTEGRGEEIGSTERRVRSRRRNNYGRHRPAAYQSKAVTSINAATTEDFSRDRVRMWPADLFPPDPARQAARRVRSQHQLGWPSGPDSSWSVWSGGVQLYSHREREVAITRARTEAVGRHVAVWLGEPGHVVDPL